MKTQFLKNGLNLNLPELVAQKLAIERGWSHKDNCSE